MLLEGATEDDIGVQRSVDEDHCRGEESKTVVKRAQNGDVAAFEYLVTQHYRFIYKTAFRWLGDQTDAEDVTQTICMRLAKILSSFDGRASFTSWLYRVTLNAVRDLQRSKVRAERRAAELSLTAQEETSGGQEDAVHVADIWKQVRQLPDKQRDAVLLVYGEEMSHADAAQIMQCKEVTVSWHIHNARKALKGRL
ncbi:RNA polymerase sigma factor [Shinella sedimenti]|uniref:Sigma-70 family RNA polymerase sigma factor n=1 Tax=Shinella sedimenti TaxID=2919913 RepID=A0ABT0CTR6_9HYPH|nr:sigma-70 family RNA polymerase sigma factor [Shinella sedimenti]MCJ8151764.1 sigma-70 family RNA polymerase sigma factor [Shinella sedimenti]